MIITLPDGPGLLDPVSCRFELHVRLDARWASLPAYRKLQTILSEQPAWTAFILCDESVGGTRRSDRTMQVNITLDSGQEESHELAEVLRAFAADYDSWMIRCIKRGRHTLHDEAGALIASLEIVKGAERERELK